MVNDKQQESTLSDILRNTQPIITLFMLLLSGLIWGLKLESKIDDAIGRLENLRLESSKDLELVRHQLEAGILPVTKERIESINVKMDQLEKRLNDHIDMQHKFK